MDAARAIENLVYRYAALVDAGDFDGVAALLQHARLTNNRTKRVLQGEVEILGMYTGSTRRYEDGTPKTKHVTTNLIVEVDEAKGTATCRSYFTVLQAVPGELALQPVIAGRYRDEFERVEGTWRFSARHIAIDLTGDLSQHLLIPPPAP